MRTRPPSESEREKVTPARPPSENEREKVTPARPPSECEREKVTPAWPPSESEREKVTPARPPGSSTEQRQPGSGDDKQVDLTAEVQARYCCAQGNRSFKTSALAASADRS